MTLHKLKHLLPQLLNQGKRSPEVDGQLNDLGHGCAATDVLDPGGIEDRVVDLDDCPVETFEDCEEEGEFFDDVFGAVDIDAVADVEGMLRISTGLGLKHTEEEGQWRGQGGGMYLVEKEENGSKDFLTCDCKDER